METIESKIINDFLKTLPKVPLREDPLFRLVWSDDMTEKRLGTYNLYFDNKVVGTTTKVEMFNKYSWIKERWILEQWYPPELSYNSELPDSTQGSYEPIFVFESNTRQALPLNMRVIEILTQAALGPKRSLMQRQVDDKNAYDAAEEARCKLDEDTIDASYMASLLHFGEAAIVPKEYPGVSPNLKEKSNA